MSRHLFVRRLLGNRHKEHVVSSVNFAVDSLEVSAFSRGIDFGSGADYDVLGLVQALYSHIG